MPCRLSISEPGECVYVNPQNGNVRVLGNGYAGFGPKGGANNPSMVDVHDVGPIAPGDYDMGGPYKKGQAIPAGKWNGWAHGATAPTDDTITLTPRDGTDTHGRCAFMVHGDNYHGDRSASHGCPCRNQFQRREMIELGIDIGDTLLTVVVGDPKPQAAEDDRAVAGGSNQ